MYAVPKTQIQKFAQDLLTEPTDRCYIDPLDIPRTVDEPPVWRYECTVTFDPKYYPLSLACSRVSHVVGDIVRYMIKEAKPKCWIDYGVEYHKNHYPHIHFHLHSVGPLDPEHLKTLVARLCKRYGRTQLYQTGHEDYEHDKDGTLIRWSEYIKKEALTNSENGKKHYFRYMIEM